MESNTGHVEIHMVMNGEKKGILELEEDSTTLVLKAGHLPIFLDF